MENSHFFDIDRNINTLKDCKYLSEENVKFLCEKVTF